jgi:hypothetical protein
MPSRTAQPGRRPVRPVGPPFDISAPRAQRQAIEATLSHLVSLSRRGAADQVRRCPRRNEPMSHT